MKRKASALMLVFLVTAAFSAGAGDKKEVLVSAAASLTNAFTDLGKKFEAENPGVKVVFNFAASGVLLQQMASGAPVDVFASADQKTMDQAVEKGLIVPGTRKNFAANSLVLIVPSKNPAKIKGLANLAGKDVEKIAVGNPETVPVGRYSKESLSSTGSWNGLSPKFIYAESVRQVLDYVSRGEVDAGFVYATDAAVAREKVKIVTVVEGHKPVIYPMAIVKAGGAKDLAAKFMTLITSAKGRDVLESFGFKNP
jgi:molybdate transport system substrate-binding protein